MGKSTLYLASALALGVSAELFAIPEATTTLPHAIEAILLDIPHPTKAPVVRALERRQTSDNNATSVLVAPDNICGYIDGRAGAPFSCLDEDFTCMFFTADETTYGNVACCNIASTTCGARGGCYGYDEVYSQSLCDSGCMLDRFMLKCTNTAQPYCNTISFTSDILDFWCNSFEDTSTQVAFTTYSGQTGRVWQTIELEDDDAENTLIDDILSEHNSATAETTTTRRTAPTTTSDGEDEEESAGGGGGNGDNGDNGGGSDDGGSSTPIGPIVGGVVGGVAVIAAVAFGVWFILRRKKKEAAGGNPPMQQAQAVPPQGPPQGPYSPGTMGAMGAVGQAPPPHQSYYDPNKGGYMQPDYQPTPPPGYPPQMHQQQHPQQHLAPGPYYAPSTIPDRTDTTSPSAVSQSNASMHRLSAVSPGSPGSQNPQQFMAGGYAPQGQQGPQQPGQPTIYEAPGPNDGHHRGQMHEMA